MSAPFPPYTYETVVKKVRGAEDGWNTVGTLVRCEG
jgi:nuclear transport factor 2 (NTF2) superfamily protein